MKRSKINQCIKDMEALIKEHGFELPPFATGHRKTGGKKDMSMMRSVTTCLDGILRTTGWEILTRSDFL